MKVRVKFCGITSVEDRRSAIKAGADAIGLVFFKDSPRFVALEKAELIAKDIPPFVSIVGVFVNEKLDFIEECVERCSLDAVQIHGDEDVNYCLKFKDLKLQGVKLIKGLRARDRESLSVIEDCPADAILLDAYKKDEYGGTGRIRCYCKRDAFKTPRSLLGEKGRRALFKNRRTVPMEEGR